MKTSKNSKLEARRKPNENYCELGDRALEEDSKCKPKKGRKQITNTGWGAPNCFSAYLG